MKKIFLSVSILFLFFSVELRTQWFPQSSANTNAFSALWAVDENTAFATTQFSIYKTSDGGSTWLENFNAAAYFDDIQFLNSDTGFAIGRASGGARIYKTINGGLNWELRGNIPVLSKFTLSILDPDTGYAGTFGGVFRSVDGGANWVNMYSGPSNFTSIYFTTVNSGWGTTDIGNIMRTSNGGISWQGFATSYGSPQHGCFFLNTTTGWVVTSNSKVYKNTTGWYPWVPTSVNIPSCSLEAVYFANDMTGWVAGCQGSIHRSTDGGITWEQQTIGTTTKLLDIKFVNAMTGWSVGEGGKILKTTNGGENLIGIQPISNEIPEKFELLQNYPNPFNPSTKIKFGIHTRADVKITVFDIIGNEISTLLNETMNPGTYEVNFEASTFASGIYYYKITAYEKNNSSQQVFTETKKMVLIK